MKSSKKPLKCTGVDQYVGAITSTVI